MPRGPACNGNTTYSPLKGKAPKEAPTVQLDDAKNIGGGFGIVLCFPLPSATTEEEEAAFKKLLATRGEGYRQALVNTVTSPYLRQSASIACEDSLASLRAATIQVFESLFATLGSTARCATFEFTSVDNDELFLCIKMSDELAEVLADRGEYPVQLSVDALPKLGIKLTVGDVVPAYCKFDKFMKDEKLLVMHPKVTEPGKFAILRQVDRIRVLRSVIADYIDCAALLDKGLLKQIFPAHNKHAIDQLRKDWANFYYIFTLRQPIQAIRDYYGEEVAFYFLFLMTLNQALLVLAVPAIVCGVLILMGNVNTGKLIFNFTCVIWFNGLVKFWNRREAHHALRWGVDRDVERSRISDPVNPEFRGTPEPWLLNENEMRLQENKLVQLRGYAVSGLVTLIYASIVMAAGVGNQYYWATYLDRTKPPDEPYTYFNSYKLATLGLSVQIQVFDFIWNYVCDWLGACEQHVTMHKVSQSKARKVFLMSFINTFWPFVFTAYFKPMLDEASCEPAGGCKALLVQNLVITFSCYISFGLMGMILPYLQMKYRIYQEAKELQRSRSPRALGMEANPRESTASKATFGVEDIPKLSLLEQQAKMDSYTGEVLTGDYLQIVFPVAFIALFGAVMPFTVLLCLVGMCVQLRADAWKLTAVMNRPFPTRVGSIGVWKTVLNGLTYVVIFNNIGLLLTQIDIDEFFPFLKGHSKLTAFFVLQNMFVIFKMAFDMLVTDISSADALEQSRQNVQRMVLFDQQDEEFNVDIRVACSGAKSAVEHFKAVPPLTEGHSMFVESIV